MADAKRCDACQTYYLPRSGASIDITGDTSEFRLLAMIAGRMPFIRVALSIYQRENTAPVSHVLDLCSKCTWEALKQVMISFAKETG